MCFDFQDGFQDYGVDWSGYMPDNANEEENAVIIPMINIGIPDDTLHELSATIDPLRSSESYGADIYHETVQFILQRSADTI